MNSGPLRARLTVALMSMLLVSVAVASAVNNGGPPAMITAPADLSPEEIVTKHLEAVGRAETRASITSRVIMGTAVATFREPGTGQLGGSVVMGSQGDKTLIAMLFENAPSYPYERIGFNGDKTSVSYVRPGVRSDN